MDKDAFDQFSKRLDERDKAIHEKLDQVLMQVKETNGRVREHDREITKIKTVGSVMAFLFTASLGWLKAGTK